MTGAACPTANEQRCPRGVGVRVEKVPSEQHERWKSRLFLYLERKLSGCLWCAMSLSRRHPRTPEGTLLCQVLVRGSRSPSQAVAWQCAQLHAHQFDILAGAARVVSEKRQAAPRSGYCQPDITILNSGDEPLAFIEVVHTHPPDKSAVVADELKIPVFVIPAPRETLVRPTLGAARPWWEFVPGFLDDEVNREMARGYESYVESRIAGPAQELEWYGEHETIVDDDGRVVWSRFRGSPPDLDNQSYPTVGSALIADYCTWSCAEATAALDAQWPHMQT